MGFRLKGRGWEKKARGGMNTGKGRGRKKKVDRNGKGWGGGRRWVMVEFRLSYAYKAADLQCVMCA